MRPRNTACGHSPAQTAKQFDIDQYKDAYTEKLMALIEAKVAGKEIVAPPEEHLPVINLMEALKQSVAQAQGAEPKPAAESKPPRKMAKSVGKKAEAKKRKTS